jgi:hypothetical protein
MIYTVTPALRNRVLAEVRDRSPRPTELLELLHNQFSYRDVQDALSELLENGRLILDSERRLRLPQIAA